MNAHKNARSCPASRELLVKRVCEQGWSVRAASEAVGMSDRRAREWLDKLADQTITYTDAASFAVMEALRCTEALTFDHDFLIAGFSRWSLAGR